MDILLLLGLIFYLSITYYILRKETLVIVLFFSSFLMQLTSYISVFYLDHGDVYMAELDTYSKNSYISLLLLIFYISTTLIFYILYFLNKSKIINYKDNVKYVKLKNTNIWIIIFFVISIILIANIIVSGSPLWVEGINKTTFWTIAKYNFLKPISSQIPAIALFSGMFLVYNHQHDKSKLISFALYMILFLLLSYLLLMGHKFGQLLNLIYMFFLPIMALKILNKTFNVNKIITILLLIISLLFIAVFNYYETKYGTNAFSMIKQRIFAMDGQVIYISFTSYLNGEISNNFDQLILEIEYIFGSHSDSYVGMKYLMDMYMQSSLFDFYEKESVMLAKAYIPILFHYFNSFIIALIVHILFIITYFFIAFQFLKYIIKFDFVLTFLYMKLYYAFLGYYAQGYTTIILNNKTLVYVLLILFIMMLRKITVKAEKYAVITDN